MNVLIIPEDFRKDQYVLKPLVQALMKAAGKPNANVRVLTDPLLGGVAKALNGNELKAVLHRYKGMVHLFLLVVDRDGNSTRRQVLMQLEQDMQLELPTGRCFLAEQAYQEVEVWALAGTTIPKDWSWSEVRAHPNPKETYFMVLAEERKLVDEPGEGRETMGKEAAGHLTRVKSLCPEVAHLEGRIQAFTHDQGCVRGPYE